MKVNKKVVKTKLEDGTEVEYTVVKPNGQQLYQAGLEANKTFAEAIKAGCIVKSKLRETMVNSGVWNEDKDKKVKDLKSQLFEKEKVLAKGAKSGLNKSQARSLAIEMRKLRNELLELTMLENEWDNRTAESQAENARFDFLVSVCSVNDEGNPVFSSFEDYRQRSTEQVAYDCASALSQLMYGTVFEDVTKNLPENIFLNKYKFVNDNGRLVDADGNLVDVEGNRIDEEGYFLNAEGKRVDKDGNLLDENGNVIDPEWEEFKD